jgi:uncharacterized protein
MSSGRTENSTSSGIVPTNLVILQPTSFCNIDCTYCYLAHRSNKRRMSLDTVQAISRFLADVDFAREPLTVCWHAGEPLTVPTSFYEEAFKIFAAGPKKVRQNIQTNGTLLNDQWCRLFKEWDVTIGLSIDGPRQIHDAHRIDRASRGTFDRVLHGIEKLRQHSVYFSVITVLTKDSVEAADELWRFYKSAGIPHVGFNIDEQEGVNLHSTLSGRRYLRSFRRFMTRIAQLHATDPSVGIREIEDTRKHLTSPPGAEVERSDNRAGAILNFDSDGYFTTFSPELLGQHHPQYGRFSWGNVHENTWADVLKNSDFLRVWKDIERGVQLCRRTCDYFSVCGGGCPSNKLAEHGTFVAAETESCRLHVQAVADVVINQLEAELAA